MKLLILFITYDFERINLIVLFVYIDVLFHVAKLLLWGDHSTVYFFMEISSWCVRTVNTIWVSQSSKRHRYFFVLCIFYASFFGKTFQSRIKGGVCAFGSHRASNRNIKWKFYTTQITQYLYYCRILCFIAKSWQKQRILKV